MASHPPRPASVVAVIASLGLAVPVLLGTTACVGNPAPVPQDAGTTTDTPPEPDAQGTTDVR